MKKRYAAFVRIVDDCPYEYQKGVAMQLDKSEKIAKLKKGVRLFLIDAVCGIDGEDFVYARHTLRLRYIGLKSPRFVSRYLLRKL